MKFMGEDFMLETKYARELYHEYARKMPIIDYHTHLNPEKIATNIPFKTITEAWLKEDQYKWRAMRTFGITEEYITGTAGDWEKFEKWVTVLPYTLRNPIYHWTHLELQRYFGINSLLTLDNAKEIYNHTNEILSQDTHTPLNLLKLMNVETLCTTDDPTDLLIYHRFLKHEKCGVNVLPSFRPDKAISIENGNEYIQYLEKLEKIVGFKIENYESLISALKNRMRFFDEMGCKLSDHGLENLYFFKWKAFDCENIFKKVQKGKALSEQEIHYFKFESLIHLGREYHRLGWVQQFHLGALRNTNRKMYKIHGADFGCDSIGDFSQAKSLASFLNELDETEQLTKTIIYNLNPSYNEVFATMIVILTMGRLKEKFSLAPLGGTMTKLTE